MGLLSKLKNLIANCYTLIICDFNPKRKCFRKCSKMFLNGYKRCTVFFTPHVWRGVMWDMLFVFVGNLIFNFVVLGKEVAVVLIKRFGICLQIPSWRKSKICKRKIFIIKII